jgi:Fibronectin type III domain
VSKDWNAGPPSPADVHRCPILSFRRFRRLSRRAELRLPAVLLSAALVAGCGVQGPAEPPRVEQPETIKDLAVIQVGQTLHLTFTLPVNATDGEELTKPLEAVVYRTVTSPQSKPGAEFTAGTPWLSLNADDVQRATRGERLVDSIKLPEAEFKQDVGQVYTIAVKTLTRGFRHRPVESRFSNSVRLSVLDVSGPPRDLAIKPTEKSLVLSWAAPDETLLGGKVQSLAGYRVYAAQDHAAVEFHAAGETAHTTFAFAPFKFGDLYKFKVRALFRQGNWTAESADSEVREIQPSDVFPPAAPSGITGIHSAAGVELVWTPNTEPDLAGYNVYRMNPEGSFVKLNGRLLPTPFFTDHDIQPDQTYVYRVTAVDLSGNESAPSQDESIDTR